MTVDSDKIKYSMALGFFDGLHIGHSAVIREAEKKSGGKLRPAVLLFMQHPKEVLFGEKVAFLLQKDIQRKKLAEMGMETVEISFFDIKDMSPEEFVKEILVEKFPCEEISCGFNYRFGKNGAGNCETLKEICKEYGINVNVCPEMCYDTEGISSTKIRHLIESGNVEKANAMLGFPFCFKSEIFSGDKRGRLLGTPTVNQFLPEGLAVPKFGVYASKVYFKGEEHLGVTNIGARPTFQGETFRSETFILSYNGNLYGEEVTVELYKFIRPEQKFDSAQALKEQIAMDIVSTKRFFGEKIKKIRKNTKK